MAWLRQFLFRLQPAFSRKRIEAELSDELRAHLELATAANVAAGMEPGEARRAAQRELGGIEQVKEAYRDQRGITWVSAVIQDLRFGARMIRKHPGFSSVTILSLGVGIAVNIVMFSMVNAVAFRPLPGVKEPEQLVYLKDAGLSIPYQEYEYCRNHNDVFVGLAASVRCRVNVSLGDENFGKPPSSDAPAYLQNLWLVSDNYFSLLGIEMLSGRGFLPEENEEPGARPVLVVSYGLWTGYFHSDPNILGKNVRLNNVTFTVVGVARGPTSLEPGSLNTPWAWVPMMMEGVIEPGRDLLRSTAGNYHGVHFFGRLKPGATLARAKAEMEVLDGQYAREFLRDQKRHESYAAALDQGFAFYGWREGDFRIVAIGVMCLASVVLAVACANVANLLLARATTRQREISVRLALGASRGRVVRQLLTESMMLAAVGGVLGLSLGVIFGQLLWPSLLGLNTTTPDLLGLFTLDWHMVTWTLLVTLATGVVFGLVPALEAVRSSVYSGLKQNSTVFGRRVSRSRLRNLLVTGQVAVAVSFLIVASLAVRMVQRTVASMPAIDLNHVIVATAWAPPTSNANKKPREFERELLDRIKALPGVKSVCVANEWRAEFFPAKFYPFGGGQQIFVDGRPPRSALGVAHSRVSPDFFATIGVPLVRGRGFTAADAASGAPVFIVSETFVQRFLPDSDPIGCRFRIGETATVGEVIGVVKDGVRAFRNRTELLPYVGDLYAPMASDAKDISEIWVRTHGDAAEMLRALPAQARLIDPSVQLSPFALNDALGVWRHWVLSVTLLVVGLGGLALLLAAAGVYGIMAYAVAQRTQEIGVRVAMGAKPSAILHLILGQGLRLVSAGLALGLVGAAGLSWIARALLYGLSPFDPIAFGGISLLLVGVALLASWVPARQATRVDPMVALRSE